MTPAPLAYTPAPAREERRALPPLLNTTGPSGMSRGLNSIFGLSVLYSLCQCSWVLAWLAMT